MSLQHGRRPSGARNYNIAFVTSQRGMEMPAVDGYVFVCKDKACTRFVCRTKSCRSTLTLKHDDNGPYTDETPTHTHPPHESVIASLTYKHKTMEEAKKRRSCDATTRSIATKVRANESSVRRLSTDRRFIRRFGGAICALKTRRTSSSTSRRPRSFSFTPEKTMSSFSATSKWFKRRQTSRSSAWMGRSVDAHKPISNLSRVTAFVGTGFRSHLCLPSSQIRSRRRIQRSSQRSIHLHNRSLERASFRGPT